MSGPGSMLDLIRSTTATTRGELLDHTGLSRMTVSTRLQALLDAGLITEGRSDEATGGRRAKRLALNPAWAHVVAAAVDTTHATISLTDLHGTVLAEDHVTLDVAAGPEPTLDVVSTAAQGLRERAGLAAACLLGTGISLTGPVDPATGHPSQPPILPGWDDYPVPEYLEETLGAPAVVANDADAEALGEQRHTYPDARSVCYVKVSSGIGVGIVIDGHLYSGSDGGAGDIGHIRLAGQDAECRCGAQGCLAAVASGWAVARHLADLGKDTHTSGDVRTLLLAGDDAARITVEQAGTHIGEVLAGVVALLNPNVLVLGGALASAELITGVRKTLYARTRARATAHLSIHLARLGDRAPAIGLTSLVTDRELAPARIDALLT